jgi:hypothetical protein
MATPNKKDLDAKDLEKARTELNKFKGLCEEAKEKSNSLGFTDFVAKIDSKLGETQLVTAEKHLEVAQKISKKNMKEAKEIAELAVKEVLGAAEPTTADIKNKKDALKKELDTFINKGVTKEPSATKEGGEGGEGGKGAAPSAGKKGEGKKSKGKSPEKIITDAENLLSQKKYENARKAAAELMRLAKENSDAELEKRASDLVEKIRAEEFKGLEEKVAKEKEATNPLAEEEVSYYLQGLMKRDPDINKRLADEIKEAYDDQKKIIQSHLSAAKEDSHELELVKKTFFDHYSEIEMEYNKRIRNLPGDARDKVYVKKKPAENFTELKVLFYDLSQKEAGEMNKFISEWK